MAMLPGISRAAQAASFAAPRVVAMAPKAARRPFFASAPALSSQVFSHKDSSHNHISTVFEFTPENYKLIKWHMSKYPPAYKRSAVIPMLHIAQEQNDGWIPLAAMNKIARILEINPMRVYEVATFYTMFRREPIGKNHVQVCTTTPCMIRGAYDILKVVQDYTGCKVGESSKDGLWHVSEAECLGACVNAPMVQVAGEICQDSYFEDLTPETTIKMLDTIKSGKKPTVGPQNGRVGCIGIQGKTCLHGEPPGPGAFFRTDGAL